MRPKKIEVNGKEVTIKLDLNAIIRFCENYDIDFSGWESALNHPTKIRYFIWSMAKSGNPDSDITEEEIGSMAIEDMTSIMDSIGEQADPKKGKKGKKE